MDEISNMNEKAGLGRRGVLRAAGIGALGLSLPVLAGPAAAAPNQDARGIVSDKLRFAKNGQFKIVQFNDTQDSHRTDRRTIQLQKAVLDDVKPDFVVINGDVITGGPTTELEAKQALNNVVLPMEERSIPWALTFGNHDEDSTGATGFDERDMIDFVRSYKYNLNTAGADVTGTGNQVLTVAPSEGGRDAFAIWLLDSGRYAPKSIAGQDFAGYPHWDWLRFDQVEWYAETSRALEKRRAGARARIPAHRTARAPCHVVRQH